MTTARPYCEACNSTGWVCEAHNDRPWEGPGSCGCGAPGEPCLKCNDPDGWGRPRMPPGFEIDHDVDDEPPSKH